MPTARRHTRNALTAWGTPRTTLDDAALVVSELVTNAQQHTAHGPTELCLLAHGNWLIVSVHDPCPAHIPIPGPPVGAG
ncbi:ATP-binding protein [Streptomyces sp. NPDC002835]